MVRGGLGLVQQRCFQSRKLKLLGACSSLCQLEWTCGGVCMCVLLPALHGEKQTSNFFLS